MYIGCPYKVYSSTTVISIENDASFIYIIKDAPVPSLNSTRATSPAEWS